MTYFRERPKKKQNVQWMGENSNRNRIDSGCRSAFYLNENETRGEWKKKKLKTLLIDLIFDAPISS